MALLAPSIHALNCLISICLNYAEEYSILFNGSKSKFMVFRHEEDKGDPVAARIGEHVVQETKVEMHLGHKINFFRYQWCPP